MDVLEHFQNISNDTSVHELADLFKNKTVQKDEKLKAAMELVGGDENLEAFMKTLGKLYRFIELAMDFLPF